MGETGKRYRPERDDNGNNKDQRRRIDRDDNKSGKEIVAYRILSPNTVIGNVIGKSGKMINLIRQDTRAKVKVVDLFPGVKDRVIITYCYVNKKLDVDVDDKYNDKEPLCPSQDALLRLHCAIANAVATSGEHERKNGDREECTLLVPGSQTANIIGKSGSNIKKLRTKTRANIKIIARDARDPNHSCAMDFDNFVQITGDSEAVKKALFAVSAIIYKFPPKEEIPLDINVNMSEIPPSIIIPADMPIYPTGGYFGSADPMFHMRSGPPLIDPHAPELPLSGYGHTGGMWPVVIPNYGGASRSEELTIRVVCPSDKIALVIGKGGSTIKSIRQATGARIEVNDTKASKDKNKECLITIVTTESLDDVQSRTVEAVLLLQERINDDAEKNTFQLLVPSRNIGCIIGKAGSIILEIRKKSRANIRITKAEKTMGGDSDEEYVEVSGQVKNVRDALVQIVLRLRDDALKDRDGSSNPSGRADPIYGGGKGFSALPLLSSIPPGKHMGYDSYEPRTESRSGMGMLSSSGHYEYGSLSMGEDDYGSSYPSKHYGGSLPSSTLEILIPAHSVGKVIGKSGGNITNIRQISGAVIEISESRSSRGDRLALISGTPEQKLSAENLIQAFIMAT